MEIKFWGVRGSIATSGEAFSQVGGNTTCLEVREGTDVLIIDAGTGIRALGDSLAKEASARGEAVSARILFTHLHWDHIQGFPFFSPGFVPSTELELFGPGGELVLETLSRQMRPPNFPVPLTAMRAKKRFFDVKDGDRFDLSPFTVTARSLNHPQGVMGYRIECKGRSLCFATDTECLLDDALDDAIVALARDVDLLVLDAQYTQAEYDGRGHGPCRRGWGHSTYDAAIEVAKRAGARNLALFHHDPTRSDTEVAAIERVARTRFSSSFAAREGETVSV